MTESIHGHEVMRMMIESEKEFTKERLAITIKEKFGAGARFHTCAADDMTAEALIDFLESKGKFVESGKGFKTDKDKICNH